MHLQKLSGLLLLVLLAALFEPHCTKERHIDEPGRLVPLTVDQDPALPSISVNGALLHAEAFGPADSALIVVLHGGPGGDYRSLLRCRAFAEHGYRVVFYDQRGSGLSQRFPVEHYSLQGMFDDLSGVIAHYRTSPAQRVFLLAHSWGAMLAAAYIDQNPAAVDGVVLSEPGGLVWDDIVDYIGRSGIDDLSSELTNDVLYADQFMTGKPDEHAVLDYKFALQMAAGDHPDSPMGNEGRVPFWRGGAAVNRALLDIGRAERPDWTTNLDQFDTNVLFLYSEKNRAYGAAHAQKVASAFTNVELLEITGAGHDMLYFPTGWNQAFPKMLHYFDTLKH